MKATKKISLSCFTLLFITSFSLSSCDSLSSASQNSSEPTSEEQETTTSETSEETTHTHTFTSEWSYDDEYHWHESTCGHTGTVSSLSRHDETLITITEPTCTQDGEQILICSICNFEHHVSISPALGHDFSETIEKAPTCGEPGYETLACSRCGEVYEHIEIPATGMHDFGDFHGTLIKEPNCTEDGIMRYTCINCGYEYDHSVEKLGHDFNGQYTSDSVYHWKICSRCGEVSTKEAHVSDGIYHTNIECHYNICTICEAAFNENEHDFDNFGDCQKCGHEYPIKYIIDQDLSEVTVTGASEDWGGELTIPSMIKGYPVTSLYNPVRENGEVSPLTGLKNYTSLTMPSSVTRIGAHAFDNTDGKVGLTSIDLSNNLTEIGSGAFQNSSISSILLPEYLEQLGSFAFNGSALTQIIVPARVTSIKEYTFASCLSLGSAAFSSGLTDFGPLVFYYCQNLKYVTFSSKCTVKEIGYMSFYHCESLNSITLPATLESIGMGAFSDCYSLTSLVLPSGITYIGTDAFEDVPLTDVYSLSEEPVSISYGSGNASIQNASWHYYSEEKPTDTNYSYWHYVGSTPTVW